MKKFIVTKRELIKIPIDKNSYRYKLSDPVEVDEDTIYERNKWTLSGMFRWLKLQNNKK